jgi:hypothetical protein
LTRLSPAAGNLPSAGYHEYRGDLAGADTRKPRPLSAPGSAQSEYHQRESVDAHLTIVFATLAVTGFIQARTGRPIKRFICTARRCRTIPTAATSTS